MFFCRDVNLYNTHQWGKQFFCGTWLTWLTVGYVHGSWERLYGCDGPFMLASCVCKAEAVLLTEAHWVCSDVLFVAKFVAKS